MKVRPAARTKRGVRKPKPLPSLAPPRPLDEKLFAVRQHALPNGLRIRLLEDHTVPAATLYTFFDVGSRNERPGMTGIAHLFEHMMFNGAEKYGPKEFDRLLESNGGSSNAYTSHDLTVYHEDFAAEALELVLDLESDRMRSLKITPEMLSSEREVVKEERRLHVENDIFGLVDEELYALAYLAHPYRWPIIGWMADLDCITAEACQAFFRTYYAPNNAALWLVGDFESDKALRMIERAYGDIPRGPPPPPVAKTEPPQRGERRSSVAFPAQAESFAIGYKAVATSDALMPVLDVIQYALTAGEGGRLAKLLVYDHTLASDVAADFSWKRDPGLFQVLVELNPKVKSQRAIDLIDAELERLCDQGLTDRELLRAKGQLRAHHLREMATGSGRAHALGFHETILGDYRGALEMAERYAAVSNDDVKQAARKILQPTQRTVVTLDPRPLPAEVHP